MSCVYACVPIEICFLCIVFSVTDDDDDDEVVFYVKSLYYLIGNQRCNTRRAISKNGGSRIRC